MSTVNRMPIALSKACEENSTVRHELERERNASVITHERLMLFRSQWNHQTGSVLSCSGPVGPRTGNATDDDLQKLLDEIIQHTAAERQEMRAILQETEAELQEAVAEAKSYVLELHRVERDVSHLRKICHAQLRARNDYLVQQAVDIEAQHRISKARCAELEEKVKALVCSRRCQERLLGERTEEICKLRGIVDSAIKRGDLQYWEKRWAMDFGITTADSTLGNIDEVAPRSEFNSKMMARTRKHRVHLDTGK